MTEDAKLMRLLRRLTKMNAVEYPPKKVRNIGIISYTLSLHYLAPSCYLSQRRANADQRGIIMRMFDALLLCY